MRIFHLVVVLLGALTISLTGAKSAQAHNNPVHLKIVNLAWQVMRASSRDGLASAIHWDNQPAPGTAPSLEDVGDCSLPATDPHNLCGEVVTPDLWLAYLDDIKVARQRLNDVKTELPVTGPLPLDASCATAPDTNVTLKNYAGTIREDYLSGVDLLAKDITPNALSCPQTGVAQLGIYNEFTIPDDGQGNQGLVLGWQAQHRDDDQSDTEIDVTIGAQIVEVASDAVRDFGAGALLPFVVIYDIFAGINIFDSVHDAEKLAGHVNVVDYIEGILPGVRNDTASTKGRTVWHFINVRTDSHNDGVSNFYDDNQGLLYEEAGPRGELSGLDHALLLAGDLGGLTLDASNSAGTERYEITDKETTFGHTSSNRTDIGWQSQTIGHLAFAPLDNFALFGDADFPDGRFGGTDFGQPRQMGWPLHAIGDASVPQHVVGTTGWGHKPWEGFVQDSWGVLMFEPDGCPPDKSSAVAPSGLCTPDTLRLDQLKQAQRILQRGFRWNRFLQAHADVRDFITQIARDTLAVAGQDQDDLDLTPGHPPGLWCDPCSSGREDGSGFPQSTVTNIYTTEAENEAFNDNEGYYSGTLPEFQAPADKQSHFARIFSPSRQLVEQAVGASIGYLVSRGQGTSNSCTATNNSCSVGAQCCPGSRCQSKTGGPDVCCVTGAQGCFNNDDCCSGSCTNNICDVGLQDTCNATRACGQGECLNGTCCQENAAHCASNTDCCSNRCQSNTCLATLGGSCAATADCATGTCGPSGTCCGGAGQSCSGSGDCCNGASCTNGSCSSGPAQCSPGVQACSGQVDCPAGDCIGGCCVAPR